MNFTHISLLKFNCAGMLLFSFILSNFAVYALYKIILDDIKVVFNIKLFNPKKLFLLFDQYHKNEYKSDVCLIIRSFGGDSYFLNYTMNSVDQFWPSTFPEKIIVFDEGEDYLIDIFKRIEWKFYTEKFPPPIKISDGFIGKQWSQLNSDLYCNKSEYVAILDTDSFLSTKVTPDLLFNPSGFPFLQLANIFQRRLWKDDSTIMGFKRKYNGMVKLPFVIKKEHIRKCRKYIEKLHNNTLASIVYAFPDYCAINLLSMFIFRFHKKEYDIRYSHKSEPIMQYTVHLPYSFSFNTTIENYKRSEQFIQDINTIMINGICSSFMPNTIEYCAGIQSNFEYYWKYNILVWKNIENINKLYQDHFIKMWIFFEKCSQNLI
ncbi:hypothetical protein TRFO_36400 [Tritrichomonas foetus]|uniref:Uncharacterized protein n=1 Tax=Tritrichomonas foetus TaxID=1144522 RepID=A0A1J4JGE0_9EUKA|nr:hypothetical protein TRFO_36400 [Tritrichomonas foetus]|eukprot:OHS97367.1 hypothetical protein TRFO_36400 [Tritrichomonas foetus]